MTNEKRILLIDHSETALAIMSKLVAKHVPGVSIDVAHTSEEALARLREHKYHLITMSRNLPDTDCHVLVEQIRKSLNVHDTPLIVVSGENLGLFEENLACEYVNGYFDKSLGQHKLVAYIKSFLSEDVPETIITGNILYVEDSPTVSRVVQNMLGKHGHTFLLAKDAEHALQHLQRAFTEKDMHPFDLVLTDILLEGYMSGRDLIREIRHGIGLDYQQLPILVTTSSNYDADPRGVNRIFSAGASDILEKPIRETMLIAKLNTLLKLRNQYLIINQRDNKTPSNNQAN